MIFQKMGGDDMEMGMQEPGEMCCCGWHEHEPATTERNLKELTEMHEPANHIIISCRSISNFF
jgi:hypothetical protein